MKPEPPETIEVDESTVTCEGGGSAAEQRHGSAAEQRLKGGPLGHPRVYLTLDADGQVECPYCDRLFVRRNRD